MDDTGRACFNLCVALEPNLAPDAALPDPSAELVLIRVLVSAHLATTSRRRAEAFLRHASELLATEESAALLFPIRPHADAAEVSRARRQAVNLYRQLMPTFIAAMTGRR